MEDSPDAKKPCKGILKTSSSFDRPTASYRKSAKFDELNVLQTYHPIDKDYGHMKIEEPKTPYNYNDVNAEPHDQLDANLLAEKLRIAADTQSPSVEDDTLSEDEEFTETEDEKARRIEFERRRKAHYNEYEAVKLARKLIEEELSQCSEDDDDLDTSITGDAEAVGDTKNSDAATATAKNDPEHSTVLIPTKDRTKILAAQKAHDEAEKKAAAEGAELRPGKRCGHPK